MIIVSSYKKFIRYESSIQPSTSSTYRNWSSHATITHKQRLKKDMASELEGEYDSSSSLSIPKSYEENLHHLKQNPLLYIRGLQPLLATYLRLLSMQRPARRTIFLRVTYFVYIEMCSNYVFCRYFIQQTLRIHLSSGTLFFLNSGMFNGVYIILKTFLVFRN